MHEITGDLFESEKADAICILTNGFVNAQGANTMGKGCAGEAKHRWPGIQLVAGAAIGHSGNNTHLLTTNARSLHPGEGWKAHTLPYHLLTFPTKHHWKDPSDPELIERSAYQLVELATLWRWNSVVLPRPGCGAGGLNWEDEVRPLIAQILDERFWVITFK